MNSKYTKLVPLLLIAPFVISVLVLFSLLRTPLEDYNAAKQKQIMNAKNKEKYESQIKKLEMAETEENMKLQSLKPIYESKLSGSTDNLGVFGNMFDEIIKKAQYNGLLIRSIEYDMKPVLDPIYINFPETYNACELKFFFVGTYSQLQAFLNDMNKNFPNLMYISNLSVTAFASNTDYLLIKTSINLYSKKKVVTR